MKRSINIVKKIGPWLFWLGLFGLWQVADILGLYSKVLFPGPWSIISSLINDGPLVLKHLGSTLTIAAYGLFLGVFGGMATALVVDRLPGLKPYIWPFITLSQTLPPFLIYPLLLLALGFGHSPRIVIAALVCYFPVAVSFAQGLKETDPDKTELFRNMGASTWDTYRYLRVPTALPTLSGGLKIAAAYSVVAVVFGEMMGGPLDGIGFYMMRKIDSFQPAAVYGAVVLISVTTLIIIKIFEYWENKMISKSTRSGT